MKKNETKFEYILFIFIHVCHVWFVQLWVFCHPTENTPSWSIKDEESLNGDMAIVFFISAVTSWSFGPSSVRMCSSEPPSL